AGRLCTRFRVSPIELIGDADGHVRAMRLERNVLVTDATGGMACRGTGRIEEVPVGLVFRSVGYKGVPLPGVPFDERRGVIPNDRGRVGGSERTYAAGWIKRGPSGVIGTNKKDATETVELLLEDARAGLLHATAPGDLAELLE